MEDVPVNVIAEEATEPNGSGPRLGSLAARIAQRRDELERREDDLIDVPGFEDVFKLQVKPVGSKSQQRIVDRHERIHDKALRGSYINADILVAATVGFWEVMPNGTPESVEGITWKDVAMSKRPELGPELTHRQALLAVIPDHMLNLFATNYMDWLRGTEVSVSKDLEKDF
ncbi:MAG TPA: hypothetical protein VGG82_07680 [Casimicrobiaceae bacterium]|jgi:hypothetical protein